MPEALFRTSATGALSQQFFKTFSEKVLLKRDPSVISNGIYQSTFAALSTLLHLTLPF